MPFIESKYTAPRWFQNAYLQSIYSLYLRKVPKLPYIREKVISPDNETLYLDWLPNDKKNLVIISHGIGGDSQSRYTRGMARALSEQNWSILAWNMRGRGHSKPTSYKNHYHSGFTQDLRFIIKEHVAKKGFDTIILIGFSMGANIVLKYLGEEGEGISPRVKAALAISAPIDLVSCAERADQKPHWIYSKRILRKLKKKHLESGSLKDYFGKKDLEKIRTWKDFDEQFIAPLHGFKNAHDYRLKASSKPLLGKIQIPTLLLNAKDDPLLPEECYISKENLIRNPHLHFEYPCKGGHLGFVSFDNRGYTWSEKRALEFIESTL